MNEKWDVVVIGGGAAGLSGALALARARRSVLVIDSGSPRNAPAGHIHNYLGREGTPPLELLSIGRDEVATYGGQFRTGTVTSVTISPAISTVGGDSPARPARGRARDASEAAREAVPVGGFEVALADGTTVMARRLLVTTGLVDELPDIDGLAKRWGRDVLHCPYCHGWEVRDQAIGIIATNPAAAMHQALLFRQWSADITLFLHTIDGLPDAQLEELAARDITVVEGKVAAVEVSNDELTGVRLASGETVARQALVVMPRMHARSELFASLGLAAEEQMMGDHPTGSFIPADPTGATTVPGVWVAGNVTNLMAQVIMAAAAGLQTGAVINADLVAEETRLAVAAYRRQE